MASGSTTERLGSSSRWSAALWLYMTCGMFLNGLKRVSKMTSTTIMTESPLDTREEETLRTVAERFETEEFHVYVGSTRDRRFMVYMSCDKATIGIAHTYALDLRLALTYRGIPSEIHSFNFKR